MTLSKAKEKALYRKEGNIPVWMCLSQRGTRERREGGRGERGRSVCVCVCKSEREKERRI